MYLNDLEVKLLWNSYNKGKDKIANDSLKDARGYFEALKDVYGYQFHL